MNGLREIEPGSIQDNVFRLIGQDWMLITAGTEESWNTMTASWGGFGVLWNRQVTFCFVRPVRHTYRFTERHRLYTLSFFGPEHRDALQFCGSHSGRDVDKAAATGLKPVAGPDESIFFEQARLVLECRKLYHHDIEPAAFLDPSIETEYPDKDYHRMYVGEVVRCLAR